MKKDPKPILTFEEKLERFRKRFICGDRAKEGLKNKTISDSYTVYPLPKLYDEIYVSDEIEDLAIANSGGGVVALRRNQNSGEEVCDIIFLPFSSLTGSLVEYGQDLKPTGIIYSGGTIIEHSELYDSINRCSTELEVYNVIKGKILKVVDIKKVIIPRYNAAKQVVGIREVKLALFSFSITKHQVEDIKNFSVYNSNYFYKDYEIILDTSTGKYGIRNNVTGENIIKCIYDEIKWGGKENSHRSLLGNIWFKDPEGFVRFFYDGKTAICRTDNL